jgi:hypothetical protein
LEAGEAATVRVVVIIMRGEMGDLAAEVAKELPQGQVALKHPDKALGAAMLVRDVTSLAAVVGEQRVLVQMDRDQGIP